MLAVHRVVSPSCPAVSPFVLLPRAAGPGLYDRSIRRIRLRGVAFRGITPGDARTRVAAAWRGDDRNPLVAQLLAAMERPSG
ncbi:hypothetical protein ACIBHX_08450 [Nonomuraea sp. NPDC050536]|uniref:hypothetical protein n=1 Tax=Nonomuraea sp. NPDC050536 TaxID=3364366 RepID=UPI0037CABF88